MTALTVADSAAVRASGRERTPAHCPDARQRLHHRETLPVPVDGVAVQCRYTDCPSRRPHPRTPPWCSTHSREQPVTDHPDVPATRDTHNGTALPGGDRKSAGRTAPPIRTRRPRRPRRPDGRPHRSAGMRFGAGHIGLARHRSSATGAASSFTQGGASPEVRPGRRHVPRSPTDRRQCRRHWPLISLDLRWMARQLHLTGCALRPVGSEEPAGVRAEAGHEAADRAQRHGHATASEFQPVDLLRGRRRSGRT